MPIKDNGNLDSAYHEAGHAVFSYLLKVKFKQVSLTDSEEICGCIDFAEQQEKLDNIDCKKCRERLIPETWAKISLAGPLSEKKFNPKSNLELHNTKDFYDAKRKLGSVILDDNEVEAYCNWIKIQTKNRLALPEIESSVEEVAKRLFEKKLLSYDDVKKITENVQKIENEKKSERFKQLRLEKAKSDNHHAK